MSRTRRRTRRTYQSLAEYLAHSGDTQQGVAAAVGTDQTAISRIAAGDTYPRPHLAQRLAKHCRIPVSSFIDAYVAAHPEERAS